MGLAFLQMCRELLQLTPYEWGEYAFSQDFLRAKVPADLQKDMIGKAMACGAQWAVSIIDKTKQCEPEVIARQLGLEVVKVGHPMSEKGALFAQFVPPGRIEIMTHPMKVYAELLNQMEQVECLPLPDSKLIEKVLIAHELFHFLEEENAQDIYTRTEKVRLWKMLWIKNDSTIRALGEIAAMEFAKCLTGLLYSPYMLNFMLFYGYNRKTAKAIYQDMIRRRI